MARHASPARAADTTAADPTSPAFAVTSVDRHRRRTRRARHVPGAAVPRATRRRSPAMVTDSAGNPTINGSQDLDRQLHLRAAVHGAERRARRRRPSTGTACSGARARSRAARSAPASPDDLWAARPTGSACRRATSPNVARNLQDMSTFDTQVDHMLQGFVNFQFLGRLINSTSGFVTNAAFQSGGKPLFQTHDCHFMGYSQGGIMGGAVSALCTEWTRAILGVPGMDYGGLLLNRSVDWNEFSADLRQGVHRPGRPAGRAAARAAALGPRRERGLRRAPHVEPVSRDPREADLHHRELRRPPGLERCRPRCWRARSARRTTSPRSTRRSSVPPRGPTFP